MTNTLNKPTPAIIKNLYFFLLSAILGIELFVGIFVAPIIFFPERFSLNLPLTLAQSGMIMSEIFIKLGYILMGISILGVFYSLYESSKLLLCISFLIALLAGIFVFYFTPIILQAQNLGESSQNFQQIHTLSEYAIKIIAILQMISLLILGRAKNSQK